MPSSLLVTVPIVVGGLLALLGATWLLFQIPRMSQGEVPRAAPPSRTVVGLLAAVLVVGLGLRVHGLEGRGMSHVEVYVPNIPLPADISEPPPRLDFSSHVAFQWHDEPNPPGYYTLMFPVTRVFGTSLAALRWPGVLLGTASVALLFFLVRAWCRDDRAALLAAGCLSVHGHQIFWSQMARIYTPALFMGLASTLLLVRWIQGRGGRGTAAAYGAFTLYGLATQIYFWPFLAGQVLWVTLQSPRSSRLAALHTLIIVLGSPLWTHALYRARSSPLEAPSLSFAMEYLALGFAWETEGSPPEVWRSPPPWVLWTGFLLAGVALLASWRPRPGGSLPNTPVADGESPRAGRPLGVAAVGVALVILGLAASAHRRQVYLAASAVLPLAPLAWMPVQARLTRVLQRWPSLTTWGRRSSSLWWCLGLIPPMILVVLSFRIPLLMSRGFLIFVPYLLAAVVVGLCALPRVLRDIGMAVALAYLVGGVAWHKETQEANAHRDLVAALTTRFEPSDLVFVRSKDWVTTPTFYHLSGEWHRLVAADWAAAASRHPEARIWVPTYSDIPPPPDLTQALEGYSVVDTVRSLRCEARLYVRSSGR